MENRKRNTAIALILFGAVILFGKLIGFVTIAALCMIALGVHRIRSDQRKSGYIWLTIGALFIISQHLTFIFAFILISLGLFYMKSKKVHRNADYLQKQSFTQSLRWDKEPWILKNMSLWYVVGEIHLDLSLALLENPDESEITLVLQGVVGDVEILVPEDMGITVQASVLFGQMDVLSQKENGLLNQLVWQSANYNQSQQKVKLLLSYIVGDIDVRIV